MSARLAFVLLALSLIWALDEIAGAPSSDVWKKMVKQDEDYQRCCLDMRKQDHYRSCESCKPQEI